MERENPHPTSLNAQQGFFMPREVSGVLVTGDRSILTYVKRLAGTGGLKVRGQGMESKLKGHQACAVAGF